MMSVTPLSFRGSDLTDKSIYPSPQGVPVRVKRERNWPQPFHYAPPPPRGNHKFKSAATLCMPVPHLGLHLHDGPRRSRASLFQGRYLWAPKTCYGSGYLERNRFIVVGRTFQTAPPQIVYLRLPTLIQNLEAFLDLETTVGNLENPLRLLPADGPIQLLRSPFVPNIQFGATITLPRGDNMFAFTSGEHACALTSGNSLIYSHP